MKQLAGRIAVVTGAASGIGRALALGLARERMVLALADRDRDGLDDTVQRVRALGATATAHGLDVADETAVHAFAADVLSAHGSVALLVNNAGVSIYGSVRELATDEIAWLMNVNFWGVVYGTKAFLPALLSQPEACIVNLSSIFGLWAPPGQAAYAASKFAVRGFSESLRGELLNTGVHVVTVHPGGVATAIARNARVARAADPIAAQKATTLFDRRLLVTPPDALAGAIIDAVKRRRDRVLAGKDATRVDLLMRLFPSRAPRWFATRAAKGAPGRFRRQSGA